jgi:hypothetical protein
MVWWHQCSEGLYLLRICRSSSEDVEDLTRFAGVAHVAFTRVWPSGSELCQRSRIAVRLTGRIFQLKLETKKHTRGWTFLARSVICRRVRTVAKSVCLLRSRPSVHTYHRYSPRNGFPRNLVLGTFMKHLLSQPQILLQSGRSVGHLPEDLSMFHCCRRQKICHRSIVVKHWVLV